jgi:hypothetical protein
MNMIEYVQVVEQQSRVFLLVDVTICICEYILIRFAQYMA